MYYKIRDKEYLINQLNKDRNRKSKSDIHMLIITSIIQIVSTIIINLATNYFSGIAAGPAPTEVKQTFTCEEFVEESFFDIDFVTCVLTCEPPISNYQVIPYPYVKVTNDDKEEYIPLDFFFSQKQYVSDANGKCELKSEKTVDEFVEILQEYMEAKELVIGGGCILAIQYVDKNNELGIHLYELRNGLLIELIGADMKEAAIVIGVTHDSESVRINMLDWTIDNNNFALPDALN